MATGADRAKAYRLRRLRNAGEDLSERESVWLQGYEDRAGQRAVAASERVVHVEERAIHAAQGDGANEAVALAALAKEEGRRLDTLTSTAVNALQRACDMYHRMLEGLLARAAQQDAIHLAMLSTVREHYLARVEAEAEAIQATSAQDATPEALLMQVLQQLQKGKPKHEKPAEPNGNSHA